MSRDEVQWQRGRMLVTWRGACHVIDCASIVEVNLCSFQDAVLHADESFHLLRLHAALWMIGPFVSGAAPALAALMSGPAAPPCVRVTVQRVPWRMRDPGLLGLRLWPIAGLGRHPNDALRGLGIASEAGGLRQVAS